MAEPIVHRTLLALVAPTDRRLRPRVHGWVAELQASPADVHRSSAM